MHEEIISFIRELVSICIKNLKRLEVKIGILAVIFIANVRGIKGSRNCRVRRLKVNMKLVTA